MIDYRYEAVFPLSQAPKKTPARNDGKAIHTSTFHRWATTGCRGIRLETLRIGGTRCTSAEALQRFFERLSAADAAAQTAHVTDSRGGSGAGRVQADETDRRLDELGL
jgi:hypothetical protein